MNKAKAAAAKIRTIPVITHIIFKKKTSMITLYYLNTKGNHGGFIVMVKSSI